MISLVSGKVGKFHVRNLDVEGRKFGRNFPQSIMRILPIILILGLCAVGFSRPSASKLTVILVWFGFRNFNTEQINVFCKSVVC